MFVVHEVTKICVSLQPRLEQRPKKHGKFLVWEAGTIKVKVHIANEEFASVGHERPVLKRANLSQERLLLPIYWFIMNKELFKCTFHELNFQASSSKGG